MATLNLSTNGPAIKHSYEKIVNAAPPSGAAASSQTYGQWAVYSVQAPLVSAFQNDGGKESVLKLQSTGEGELLDLIEEFSDGRIQFAFVKVKDPNTTLPKSVLVAWCGEGVPERTKGYFTSHLATVSKLLHGYHVQVTARSDSDLTPEGIVQKVADSSGSKYSGAPSAPTTAGKPPPPASKPVFTPTHVAGGGGFKPLGGRSRAAPSSGPTDADGWGEDAPPVTRTQLEKVASAYQPTKVNMNDLQTGHDASRSSASAGGSGPGDVVRGAYQPVGKVDIAEIRRQAQASGQSQDDRPTVVKGAYEPVGKVDIAAIKAKAQGPGGVSSPPTNLSPAGTGGSYNNDQEAPKTMSERSAAFNQPAQSERLTSMPKPKVSNKFGGGSTFTGTKAPTPGGFGAKPAPGAPQVGAASRTFADQGGKTPAQLWAEKKAREGGGVSATPTGSTPAPVTSQFSGEGGWKSGYTGKSWAPVQTTHTGKSMEQQHTGEGTADEPASPPSGGVSSIRDRFAGAPPMGQTSLPTRGAQPSPPPTDMYSKPNAGVPIPGLPARNASTEGHPAEEHVSIPPPPAQPRSPTPPSPEAPSSPVRIAMPVGRTEVEPPEERLDEPPVPADAMARAAERTAPPPPEPTTQDYDPPRSAAAAVAGADVGAAAAGQTAIAQYDYEKAEDNELELQEGEEITNIDMVDEDWWMGRNSRGEEGLFPANYVELVEGGAGATAPPPAPVAAEPEPEPEPPAQAGHTATAEYDYEAAEDNELSFPEGAKITGVEFPDDDWWFGQFNGQSGLFPANYVTLDQ